MAQAGSLSALGSRLIHGEVNDILVTATGEVFFATSGGVTRLQP
jgi:hypothetical protein